MLFTASFSGILLALSIHYFYQHILATLGGFCLSFVFTLLLDRKLICATLPLGFLGQLSRLLLIVAWIILHATMIETALFTDDLQVHLNEQLKPQKASIQNSFHAQIEGLQVRRDSITQAISASEQRLLSVHDAAEMEAQGVGATGEVGVGTVATYLNQIADQRAQQEKASIERLQAELDLVDQQRKAATAERKTLLAALPHITDYGPLQRAELLHAMVWGEGHYSLKAMSLVFILIITTVELLPLIGKGLANFEEYYTLHRYEMTRKLAHEHTRGQIQQEIAAIKEARKGHVEKIRIREHFRYLELETRLNEILRRFDLKTGALEDLKAKQVAHMKSDKASTATVSTWQAASEHAKEEIEKLIPEF